MLSRNSILGVLCQTGPCLIIEMKGRGGTIQPRPRPGTKHPRTARPTTEIPTTVTDKGKNHPLIGRGPPGMPPLGTGREGMPPRGTGRTGEPPRGESRAGRPPLGKDPRERLLRVTVDRAKRRLGTEAGWRLITTPIPIIDGRPWNGRETKRTPSQNTEEERICSSSLSLARCKATPRISLLLDQIL